MPEELTELPFDMTELTTAGCYYSLVCLYDYLGTHSNITLTLAYRNTAGRRHLLRGVIDELRRTDLVSEEVQKAASCVSPYMIDGDLEDTRIVSTASSESETDIPTITPSVADTI
jgi:hypothetical protein